MKPKVDARQMETWVRHLPILEIILITTQHCFKMTRDSMELVIFKGLALQIILSIR